MKVHFSIMPFLCIAVSFCSFISHAQVSVVATEGMSGPTPYTDLKTAFDAINAGTHKAAVTLTISANTSESATAVLKASGTGGSSYSSVVIKPASASRPVISGTLAKSLVILEGTTNVTIDGSNSDGGNTKDLTIINSSLLGSAVIFLNGASGNILKNTILKSAAANSGVLVLSTSLAATGNDNNKIENNDITRTSTGLPQMGIQNVGSNGKPNTGNVFAGNRIFDFYSFGFSDGDGNIGFSTNTLLEGNEFFSTEALAPNLIAIFINNATGVTNMTISKNRIHRLQVNGSGEGIKGILLYDAVSVTVVNNMISLSDNKAEIMGISQETESAVIKILHNSILIHGTGSGSTRSFALFKNWFSTGDDIRNNQLINTRVSAGTARQYAFIQFGPGTFTSDYNNLVSTGNASNYIGGASSAATPTLYATFAEWQTGTSQDANSININPVFVSTTDLHLINSENESINNKGTPIIDISTDVDGETRSGDSPDIGADEFPSSGAGPTTPPITVVSIEDLNIASTIMYPNPVANKMMLQVQAKIPMVVSWKAFDMNGRMIMELDTQLNTGENEIELNLGNLPAGSYYLVGDTSKGKLAPIRFIKL